MGQHDKDRRPGRSDKETIEMLLEQNDTLRQAVLTLEDAKARVEARLQSVPPLLEEIDRLRAAIDGLQTEKHALQRYATGLREELDRRAVEQDRLQQELASAHGIGQRLLAQYAEAERHSDSLAHLYVTASRLHGTCNRDEVLRALRDILAFFVGCEQVAVFERSEEGEYLRLVEAWGIDREPYWRVPVGRGKIGGAALSGETYVADTPSAETEVQDGHRDEETLTACIPLKLEGRVFGAIALFALAPGKVGLTPADRELFNLLSTHAATALYCTGLHERLQRQPADA